MVKNKSFKLNIFILLICCLITCFVASGCKGKESQHEHSYLLVGNSSPTCKQKGYAIKKCQTCDDIVYDELDVVEHSFQLESLVLNHDEIDNCGQFKCTDCGELMYRVITSEDVNMPILSFNGDMSGISKENKITISVSYEGEGVSFDSDATLKWQGSSSLAYDKKNYNITFLKSGTTSKNKVKILDEWGKQSKYTLKANWIDYSQSRNIVSGRIYSQIVHSRDLEDEVSQLTNGGAVDGFPILIYLNGNFEGLYTLNMPKDDWMFGMQDDEEGDKDSDENEIITKHAALSAGSWSDECKLYKEVEDYSSGIELEFCSTEDTIGNDWVLDSFNDMVRFVLNSSDDEFKEHIEDYVNLDRTIDSMIYTYAICAPDNVAKNIMWLTYDGVHWFSSMYDMDSTWGLYWTGETFYEHTELMINENMGNKLWSRIYCLYTEKIAKRYLELRTSVLTIENIRNNFMLFDSQISSVVRNAELLKWENIPSSEDNNIEQLVTFAEKRLKIFDSVMLELL